MQHFNRWPHDCIYYYLASLTLTMQARHKISSGKEWDKLLNAGFNVNVIVLWQRLGSHFVFDKVLLLKALLLSTMCCKLGSTRWLLWLVSDPGAVTSVTCLFCLLFKMFLCSTACLCLCFSYSCTSQRVHVTWFTPAWSHCGCHLFT